MLRIWQNDPYSGNALSLSGSQTSPLVFKLAPTGGTVEVKLWLRHDQLNGEFIESSYDVLVSAGDDSGTSEASWLTFAPDNSGSPGTYTSTLDVGDVLGGMVVPFWVKITMPNTPDTGARQDIYINVYAAQTTVLMDVDLSTGTFTNTVYNPEEQHIEFDVLSGTGEWTSLWISTDNMDDIVTAEAVFVGTNVFVYYRASSDATEATATSWVGNIADVPLLGYIQVRVQFSANSFVGQTGLIKRIYGGTSFNVYKTTTVGGSIPFSSTPGDSFPAPKSVKWSGYFYAPVVGNYTFRMVSNDGHRMYVGNDLIAENWTTTSGNGTVTSSGTIALLPGWHYVEWHYYHVDGTNTISTFVKPPNAVERAVALSDFAPVEQILELERVTVHYAGTKNYRNDVLIYDGPDVPVLVSPPNGFKTELFSPELTVTQQNCEYVEFQFDFLSLFSTQYLTTWLEVAAAETVITQPPDGTRPPGIWYWRARGVRGGAYSAWSDWRVLEILPLVTHNEHLYFNANVGLKQADPILNDRYLYLNGNVGLAIHDPIVDPRFLYLNVNIATAVGRIIYPMQDYTPVRKIEFAGDDDFLIGESE